MPLSNNGFSFVDLLAELIIHICELESFVCMCVRRRGKELDVFPYKSVCSRTCFGRFAGNKGVPEG